MLNKFFGVLFLFLTATSLHAETYEIKSLISYANGKLLTSADVSPNEFDLVYIADVKENEADLQNWKFIHKYIKRPGNDLGKNNLSIFKIVNVKSGKCLRLSSQYNGYLVTGACSDESTDNWTFNPLESGVIQMKNLATGKCMNSFNSNRSDELLVVRLSDCISGPYVNSNQTWSFSGHRGDDIIIK